MSVRLRWIKGTVGSVGGSEKQGGGKGGKARVENMDIMGVPRCWSGRSDGGGKGEGSGGNVLNRAASANRGMSRREEDASEGPDHDLPRQALTRTSPTRHRPVEAGEFHDGLTDNSASGISSSRTGATPTPRIGSRTRLPPQQAGRPRARRSLFTGDKHSACGKLARARALCYRRLRFKASLHVLLRQSSAPPQHRGSRKWIVPVVVDEATHSARPWRSGRAR